VAPHRQIIVFVRHRGYSAAAKLADKDSPANLEDCFDTDMSLEKLLYTGKTAVQPFVWTVIDGGGLLRTAPATLWFRPHCLPT
jgi:hypothetical protein